MRVGSRLREDLEGHARQHATAGSRAGYVAAEEGAQLAALRFVVGYAVEAAIATIAVLAGTNEQQLTVPCGECDRRKWGNTRQRRTCAEEAHDMRAWRDRAVAGRLTGRQRRCIKFAVEIDIERPE